MSTLKSSSDHLTIKEQKKIQENIVFEMELKEERAEAQKKMAWVSLIAMLVFTTMVFLPVFQDSRIKALADLFGLFYIGMAGTCGAYMGMTAYMSKK